jgi:WD40 repeat protein
MIIKRFWFRKAIPAVLVILVVGWLSWKSPMVRQTFIRTFFPPVPVPIPTLSSSSAITPENLQDVELLEHWGNGEFKSMAWSPDERYFGIGTTLGINLYEGNSLQLLRYIELSVGGIDLLAFSPDNSLLAVASDGRAIAVYDLHEDQVVNHLEIDGWISAFSFLRDGTPVAVTFPYGSAYQARVMKEMNGEWETMALMGDATNQLYAATFDQASQLFVIGFRNSIELVDPLTGIAQTAPGSDLNGGAYLPSNALWLEPKDDGLSLGVHSSGKLLNTISFEDYFDQVLISPNGRSFAILDRYRDNMIGGSITLWQVPELREIRKIEDPDIRLDVEDNSPDGKNDMVFSPNGERLALWTSTSVVKIFPVVANSVGEVVIIDPYAGIADIGITPSGQIRGIRCTGNIVDVVELPAANSLNEWQFDKPTCGQITRDGWIASINEEYNQHLLYKIGENNSPIANLKTLCCDVFSSDGRVGASGGSVYSGEPVPVWIWQKGFGTQLWQFRDSGLATYSVSVSPSGQYVAAVFEEQTRLWINGIETGRYLPAFSRWPMTTFSPDEQYLASADAIMNLERGSQIVFEGMDDILEQMGTEMCDPSVFTTPAFSPDGQLFVAEACGVLRFWSPSTGKLLAEIPDSYFSTKLLFSSDGTSLIGFAPGSVVVWGLPEQSR